MELHGQTGSRRRRDCAVDEDILENAAVRCVKPRVLPVAQLTEDYRRPRGVRCTEIHRAVITLGQLDLGRPSGFPCRTPHVHGVNQVIDASKVCRIVRLK